MAPDAATCAIVAAMVSARVPALLVAVGLGIVLAVLVNLDSTGRCAAGSIPASLTPLSIPDTQRSDVMPLALGALGFALNSYSTMVTACGFPLKNRSDIDANQEFIALGVADIGAGLLQGFAIQRRRFTDDRRSAVGAS